MGGLGVGVSWLISERRYFMVYCRFFTVPW